ncbi:pyridoxal 5'-phosphate synthase glutaminase subunit PdxT [Candidatus Methanomassiliicoccus intestinalis]|uniref:pyridoxal 5'-phosphate synthase glutaminase subunit PdxT n=1 Tax=Candidatus Methanomassiliicoccus intestinalis TaxID=1406512 RepID=UPI0037DD097C
MKIGIIALQGAVPEHVSMTLQALNNLGLKGEAVTVRQPAELAAASALILPGGESTTISKLLKRFELYEPLIKAAENGVPIMGTCAGCILMAKEGDGEVEKTKTELLKIMDMKVNRNAFGRQRESFETPLTIKGLVEPFPGIFIRGPLIEEVYGRCAALAYYQEKIVMARQDNLIALSFHPELSADTRIHEMFLQMI